MEHEKNGEPLEMFEDKGKLTNFSSISESRQAYVVECGQLTEGNRLESCNGQGVEGI